MHALGTHLLIDLKDCNPEILDNLGEVQDAMVSAAREAKATIVDVSFHEFNPIGISGMVIIAESHLSIHTWPEYGYAAVDIFTCGEQIKPIEAARYLIERLQCKNPSMVDMKRGMLSTNGEKLPHKVADADYHTVAQ